jgi:hypothetical protein
MKREIQYIEKANLMYIKNCYILIQVGFKSKENSDRRFECQWLLSFISIGKVCVNHRIKLDRKCSSNTDKNEERKVCSSCCWHWGKLFKHSYSMTNIIFLVWNSESFDLWKAFMLINFFPFLSYSTAAIAPIDTDTYSMFLFIIKSGQRRKKKVRVHLWYIRKKNPLMTSR